MRMGDELLQKFYPEGENIRRSSWPIGDYICTDGAYNTPDGPGYDANKPHGTIWYYIALLDDLAPGYKLDFHDLGTDEWEVMEQIS